MSDIGPPPGEPYADGEFTPAIETVAPSEFDIWSRLMMGAEARTLVAEQRANKAEHRLAELLQAVIAATARATVPDEQP